MVEKITQPLTPLENTEKINEIIDNFVDKDLSNLSTSGQQILDGKQLVSNLSQTIDTSTTKYPSNNAVKVIVDNKTDVDLSNANPAQSFKEQSVGWGMPDYSAGISVSLPFTATCDGVLKVNTNGYWYGLINNGDYSHGINVISIGGGDQTSDFILPKGTVISSRAATGTNTLTFYPMKGV